MPTVTATFADRLQDLIAESKKTIVEISKDTGISTGALSNYQNDKVAASITNLKTLAEYFDVPSDYLLGLVDNIKRENIEASRQYGLTDKACECLKMLAASPGVILKVINALLEQHNDSMKEYQKENEPQRHLFKEWFYSASTGESVLSRIYSYLAILDSCSSFYVKLGEFSEEEIPISEVYYQGDAVPIDVKIVKDSRMADIKSALDSLSNL